MSFVVSLYCQAVDLKTKDSVCQAWERSPCKEAPQSTSPHTANIVLVWVNSTSGTGGAMILNQ